VNIRSLQAGDSTRLGEAGVRVFAPSPAYLPETEPNNNDSLVLRLDYGPNSVLLEGDAEAPIEEAMLREQGLQSTLLKVGHHGSLTSTRPEFLGRVAPRWAVISCGLHNRFGHPREEILQELQDAHVRTLSTDINGASCFTLKNEGVSFEAFCGMPAR
jgi:competence protein ComEC